MPNYDTRERREIYRRILKLKKTKSVLANLTAERAKEKQKQGGLAGGEELGLQTDSLVLQGEYSA